MAKYNYSTNGIVEEHMAKAIGRSLPISTKTSVEICNFIKKRPLNKAKNLLQSVIDKKAAIPFKRFKGNIGHKKGKIATGGYPENACKEIFKMLESVEANAQFKGLNTSNLIIKSIIANAASRPWHYGRQARRRMKRTNIEIVVEEQAVKEDKKETNAKKVETKKEEPKEKPTQTSKPKEPKKEEAKKWLSENLSNKK